MRKSKSENILYIHLKYPICAAEIYKDESEFKVIDSEDSVSWLFIHMDFNDFTAEPEIIRIFNEGIPANFRTEWDEADI